VFVSKLKDRACVDFQTVFSDLASSKLIVAAAQCNTICKKSSRKAEIRLLI